MVKAFKDALKLFILLYLFKQRETCKFVLNNGHEQQGMKLTKYNLGYNTRDQLRSLAISASERKHDISFFFFIYYWIGSYTM